MKVLIIPLLFLFNSCFAQKVTIQVDKDTSLVTHKELNEAVSKITVTQGKDGLNGKDGRDGKDGITTIINQGGSQLFSIKSVKDFGAKGDGVTDDYASIQATVDYCLDHGIRVCFIPLGRYKISKPIIVMKANAFVTLEILGESSFWDAAMGSEITYTGTDGFAIGIQNGKGCKVKKLTIYGRFNPPFQNDWKKFMSSRFEDFTDGVCMDSRYSPYAAIVIDPFTNLPTDKIPEDGGYPGLTSYYGQYKDFTTQTGSTGTELEELSINNFVAGIISSPNGLTRNAEISIFHKIQFENCKACIVNCQDQEKGNVIDGIYCWGGTHTVFLNSYYGYGGRMTGNYHIDHVNIAGGVVRFIAVDTHGYFPIYISHVFAESLGFFGTLNSELACEVSDSHFDFDMSEGWEKRIVVTSYGENMLFRSCNFRFYDGNPHDVRVEGNATFEHCYFSGGKLVRVN